MTEPKDFGNFYVDNKAIIQEYFETRLEIIRLKSIKASMTALGGLLAMIITLFFVGIIIFLLMFGIGMWLSKETGSYMAGFSIAAGVALVIMIILILVGKKVITGSLTKTLVDATDFMDMEEEEVNNPKNVLQ